MRAAAGLFVAGALAMALAACDVATSERVDMSFQSNATAGVRCNSALGYYALPKSYLRVRIVQTGQKRPVLKRPTDNGAKEIAGSEVALVEHADPALTFCLDHVNNPMSRDAVQVVKAKADRPSLPFLTSLNYNITDQTSLVVQALARAAFIGVSGNSKFPAQRGLGLSDVQDEHLLADIEFDPFDARDLARANRTLTQYGQCVFVDALSVLPGEAEKFCSAPDRYAPSPVAAQYAAMPPVDPHGPGVFYRPKMTMRVNVYERPPRSHEPWRLAQRTAVALSNLSPVLSLDLTRAPFANKIARFEFESGALKTACIAKGSEALGLVDIPLAITRDLVALPANIISVRIDQTTKSKELVDAETNVIKTQQAMIAALQTGASDSSGRGSPDAKSSNQAFGGSDYGKVNLSISDTAINDAGFFQPAPAKQFGAAGSGCDKVEIKLFE